MRALSQRGCMAIAGSLKAQEEAGPECAVSHPHIRIRALRKAGTEPDYTTSMATELKADRRVLYFYGVSQSAAAQVIRPPGVDLQSSIEPITCEGVICWVSRVSADEFETSLTKNMENLD